MGNGYEFIDLDIIEGLESSGNPKAVSPAGARGLYQIMPIALEDYNTMNKKSYTVDDLFNPQINREIAEWTLTVRIPQMLKHYKKPVDIKHILWAYNAGIGRVVDNVMPSETQSYITKYQNMVGKNNAGNTAE